jgi:hypothetical protein
VRVQNQVQVFVMADAAVVVVVEQVSPLAPGLQVRVQVQSRVQVQV